MARSQQDSQNPWLENPSLAAAIAVSHIYFLAASIHIFPIYYCTCFCIVIIVGGVCEAIGCGLRAASTQNEDPIGLYASQLTLIVLASSAPAFITAFNYMLFGRLLRT